MVDVLLELRFLGRWGEGGVLCRLEFLFILDDVFSFYIFVYFVFMDYFLVCVLFTGL